MTVCGCVMVCEGDGANVNACLSVSECLVHIRMHELECVYECVMCVLECVHLC